MTKPDMGALNNIMLLSFKIYRPCCVVSIKSKSLYAMYVNLRTYVIYI